MSLHHVKPRQRSALIPCLLNLTWENLETVTKSYIILTLVNCVHPHFDEFTQCSTLKHRRNCLTLSRLACWCALNYIPRNYTRILLILTSNIKELLWQTTLQITWTIVTVIDAEWPEEKFISVAFEWHIAILKTQMLNRLGEEHEGLPSHCKSMEPISYETGRAKHNFLSDDLSGSHALKWVACVQFFTGQNAQVGRMPQVGRTPSKRSPELWNLAHGLQKLDFDFCLGEFLANEFDCHVYMWNTYLIKSDYFLNVLDNPLL